MAELCIGLFFLVFIFLGLVLPDNSTPPKGKRRRPGI